VYFTQSGLGLPDEAYYREETHAKVLEEYTGHVGRMLTLAGIVGPDAAAGAAARVVAVETALAQGHWDTVAARDAQKSYNPTTRDALLAAAPAFDWPAWANALTGGRGEGLLDELIVRQPSFIECFGEVVAQTDVADHVLR